MSQLHDLFVADESEARLIRSSPRRRAEPIYVPGFNDPKQLSLLSIFFKIPPIPDPDSGNFQRIYHKYFKLLSPPNEMGSECYVAKFPDVFVRAIASLGDDDISSVTARWLKVEPSFATGEWTRQEVEDLLKTIQSTCQRAGKERKNVLYRFSL